MVFGKGPMVFGKGPVVSGKGSMVFGKGSMVFGKGSMVFGKGSMVFGKGSTSFFDEAWNAACGICFTSTPHPNPQVLALQLRLGYLSSVACGQLLFPRESSTHSICRRLVLGRVLSRAWLVFSART